MQLVRIKTNASKKAFAKGKDTVIVHWVVLDDFMKVPHTVPPGAGKYMNKTFHNFGKCVVT